MKEYVNDRLEGMYNILESSNNILLEGIIKKWKEKKNKEPKKDKLKQYKNSEVKANIKGIKNLAKEIVKNYNFEDVYVAIDDDSFGNYEKGADFKSFDDFLIIRIDDEDHEKFKKFYKELGDAIRSKYSTFDTEVEYDKSEASVYVFLD